MTKSWKMLAEILGKSALSSDEFRTVMKRTDASPMQSPLRPPLELNQPADDSDDSRD